MVYVHVHIPKTGGQAMRRSLQKASVELLKGHHRTARLYSLDKKWSSVLFSFAVVRNPWDALVSYVSYHSKHNGALPIDVFENWARKSIEDAILIRKDPIKAVQSPHAV